MVLQGSAQYWPAGTYIRCRADQPVLVEHGLYGFRILKPNCLPECCTIRVTLRVMISRRLESS
jgi:hypothetical protein